MLKMILEPFIKKTRIKNTTKSTIVLTNGTKTLYIQAESSVSSQFIIEELTKSFGLQLEQEK